VRDGGSDGSTSGEGGGDMEDKGTGEAHWSAGRWINLCV
jgi:hypothetical protein